MGPDPPELFSHCLAHQTLATLTHTQKQTKTPIILSPLINQISLIQQSIGDFHPC